MNGMCKHPMSCPIEMPGINTKGQNRIAYPGMLEQNTEKAYGRGWHMRGEIEIDDRYIDR